MNYNRQIVIGHRSRPLVAALVAAVLAGPAFAQAERGSPPIPHTHVRRGSAPIRQIQIGRGSAPITQILIRRGSPRITQIKIGRGSPRLTLIGALQAAPARFDIDAAQLMRDVEVLAADDMQGRLAGTPGGAKARAYILGRYKQIGLPPFGDSHEHRFTFQRRGNAEQNTGVNLLGFIRGTSASGRYIVVSAHYDHIGVRDGQVYNGADDNATGVAALLAVAQHFVKNPPATSLVIAAVDAEEGGIRGSRALLASAVLKKESIVLNVNIDMIGRDAKNVLYAVGTHHYPSLKPLLQGVAQPPVELRFGHDVPGTKDEDWTNSSDHAAFHQAGIPFVYFGVEDFENHHQPSDDPGTIQRELLAGATKTIIAALERFARELK